MEEVIINQLDPDRPWIGLSTYTSEEHKYFFGRDAEVRELYLKVRDSRLAILFGCSGLGKSSLIGAGLVPKLQVEGMQAVYVRFAFESRAGSYVAQIKAKLGLNDSDSSVHQVTLWEHFHRIDSSSDPITGGKTLVLILDQFEEVFTHLTPQKASEVHELFVQLADLVEGGPPLHVREEISIDRRKAFQYDMSANRIRVVLVLRDDFLPHLEEYKRLIPSVMFNRVQLRELERDQALEVVLKPAKLDGRELLSEEVATAIVDYVSQSRSNTRGLSMTAVPPLLSLICAELNRNRLLAGKSQITLEQLNLQRSDILQSFYTRSFAQLPASVREYFEDRFVTVNGHRNAVAREDVVSDLTMRGVNDAEEAVDSLVNSRFITSVERGGLQRLEITHDVLTPLVVDSRKLRRSAEEVSKAEKERATVLLQRTRLIRVASLLALLTVGSSVAGWIAIQSSIQANSSRLLAEAALAESRQSESRAIKAEQQRVGLLRIASHSEHDFAQQMFSNDRWREGVKRLCRAIEFDQSNINAQQALWTALNYGIRDQMLIPRRRFAVRGVVRRALLSEDSRCLAVLSNDPNHYACTLFDPLVNAPVRSVVFPVRVSDICFSADHQWLAATTVDGGVRLLNRVSGEDVVVSQGKDDSQKFVAFSPNGLFVAVGGRDGSLSIWSCGEWKMPKIETRMKGSIVFLAFGLDQKKLNVFTDVDYGEVNVETGEYSTIEAFEVPPLVVAANQSGLLVSAHGDGSLHFRRNGSGASQLVRADSVNDNSSDRIWSIRFNSRGTRLVTSHERGFAQIWDATNGERVANPLKHDLAVNDACFGEDDKWIATACDDGQVRIWDPNTASEVMASLQHAGEVWRVQYYQSINALLTCSIDGYARLWPVFETSQWSKSVSKIKVVNDSDGDLKWRFGAQDFDESFSDASQDPVEPNLKKEQRKLFLKEKMGLDDHLAFAGDRISLGNSKTGEYSTFLTLPFVISGSGLAISENAIYVGGVEGSIAKVQLPALTLLNSRKSHTKKIQSLDVFNDLVLSSSEDSSVSVYSQSREKVTLRIQHNKPVKQAVFDSDATHVFTVSEDTSKIVRCFDSNSGKEQFTKIRATRDQRLYAARDRKLIFVLGDHSVQLWQSLESVPIGPVVRVEFTAKCLSIQDATAWLLADNGKVYSFKLPPQSAYDRTDRLVRIGNLLTDESGILRDDALTAERVLGNHQSESSTDPWNAVINREMAVYQ